jgi:hypothetical protein
MKHVRFFISIAGLFAPPAILGFLVALLLYPLVQGPLDVVQAALHAKYPGAETLSTPRLLLFYITSIPGLFFMFAFSFGRKQVCRYFDWLDKF